MTRNRQITLYGTLGVMIASVLVRYGPFSGGDSVVVAHDTIQVATQRLELLQRKAALVPGKEEVLKQVQAELAEREKGVVQAGTAEEARAHLMDVLHRTALANGFSTQSATELPEPKTLGKNKEYGQVSVGQNFTCGIDQLVNFLAAIANEPEILATESIFVQPPLNKNKDIVVRLTLSGVIPRKLIPVKKGDNFQ
jgi:hypothetical protein